MQAEVKEVLDQAMAAAIEELRVAVRRCDQEIAAIRARKREFNRKLRVLTGEGGRKRKAATE